MTHLHRQLQHAKMTGDLRYSYSKDYFYDHVKFYWLWSKFRDAIQRYSFQKCNKTWNRLIDFDPFSIQLRFVKFFKHPVVVYGKYQLFMSKLAYTVACPMNRVNGFQRCFYDISTHAHIIVHWLKKFTYKKPVSKRECVYLNAPAIPKDLLKSPVFYKNRHIFKLKESTKLISLFGMGPEKQQQNLLSLRLFKHGMFI